MNESRPAVRALLAAGVLSGLALAIGTLVGPGAATRAVPRDAVALVNGEPIRREDLARALAAVAKDRKAALGSDEVDRLRDRLIDEELLLQRGLELSLPRHDPRVRADLVRAMIDLTVSDASAREPTDAEVIAYYDAHTDYFVQPGRVRVRQVLAADEAGARRASERLRAGDAMDRVRADVGRVEPAPVPDVLLPAAKLREYVGEGVAVVALGLAAGAVSDPVSSSTGWHVVQMIEREPDRVPPLDQVRDLVRAEVQRRAGDEALVAHLARLRAAARLVLGTIEP